MLTAAFLCCGGDFATFGIFLRVYQIQMKPRKLCDVDVIRSVKVRASAAGDNCVSGLVYLNLISRFVKR